MNGPIASSSVGAYSCSENARSIRSSIPHAPDTRRNTSAAPAGAYRSGRAGSLVPGQPATGTGCWRGA